MSHIFVSYSRRDSGAVKLLVSALEKAGHEVWVDQSAIQGGTLWQEEIVKAVGSAEVFLLVVSSHSVESEHVERELALASLKGKRIVPLILNAMEVPDKMEYALAGVERIAAAGNFEAGIKDVVELLATPAHQNARPVLLEADLLAPAPRPSWQANLLITLLIVLILGAALLMHPLFGLAEGHEEGG
jgi:hypothetical protein